MPMSGLKGPRDGVEFGSLGQRTVDSARDGFLCLLPVSPRCTGAGMLPALRVPETSLLVLSGMWQLCRAVLKRVLFVDSW